MVRFDKAKLRQARKESGQSVGMIVKKLYKDGYSTTHQSLYNWESGLRVPDARALSALAMFYGKSVAYFFTSK